MSFNLPLIGGFPLSWYPPCKKTECRHFQSCVFGSCTPEELNNKTAKMPEVHTQIEDSESYESAKVTLRCGAYSMTQEKFLERQKQREKDHGIQL